MRTGYGKMPWSTDEAQHDCPHQNIRILDASGSGVCLVWMDDAPVEDYNRRAQANAKLLVRAPEMAELLNEINNWLVCSVLATAEDMAQSFEPFQKRIEELLVKAGVQ